METPIQTAVRLAGSQAALAKMLDASPAFVSHWATGRRPVPPRFCRLIESLTKGQVTKHQLRPDVFGEPSAAAANDADPDADRIAPPVESA